MISYSENQKEVILNTVKDIIGDVPEISIGGLAGTGKTTCLNVIIDKLENRIPYAVLTPTGKAANVLRMKGVPANTIHSAIYNYIGIDDTPEGRGLILWNRKEKIKTRPKVVFVDEASMVNKTMYNDLKKFGIQLVWIGDYGQLPPIGEDPGLMKSPKYILTDIYRNTSGIIKFAHEVRTGEAYTMEYNDVVFDDSNITDVINSHEFDQIICGFNATRTIINNLMRIKFGFKDQLNVGDKMICLNNNSKLGIYNGQQFIIEDILNSIETHYKVVIKTDFDEIMTVWLNKATIGGNKADTVKTKGDGEILSDYGYAITCHKSQGSEWNDILVINENSMWDNNRWLYTAVTRAKKTLRIIL